MSQRSTEDIARICHEVNRAYCAAIGDGSQVAWEQAPDWQRASCLAGVQAILDRGYANPELQHLEWMRTKLKDGWTYGLVKDAAKKQHPCMVFPNELTKEHRAKDSIFGAIVMALSDAPRIEKFAVDYPANQQQEKRT